MGANREGELHAALGQKMPRAMVNVLIVEDDIEIGLDIEAMVVAEGYQVLGPARSVKEAMVLAREADIALVDLRLADGITGGELARQLSVGFNVAVIYVTGSPDDAVLAPEGHALAVVAKPHNRMKVAQALSVASEWLATRKVVDTSRFRGIAR